MNYCLSIWRLGCQQKTILSLRLFVTFACLFLVFLNVLLLQLPHPLDLVQINHKTLIVRMELLDTLPAENGLMIRAVEVLNSLLMFIAQFLLKVVFIFLFKVECCFAQDLVFFDNFIEDIDIERESLRTLQLLDKLSADGASDSVLVVELLDAVGAESVAAMD